MFFDGIHGAALVLYAVIDFPGIPVTDYLADRLRKAASLPLEPRYDIEQDDGGQQAAVAVEKVAEIVVAGQFSAPDTVNFAELFGGPPSRFASRSPWG